MYTDQGMLGLLTNINYHLPFHLLYYLLLKLFSYSSLALRP